MKVFRILIMAMMTLVGVSCSQHKSEDVAGKEPITKPQITIEGGRLTPEGLWAMGRIGSVAADIETGWVAYTVSYYSVEENRSTTWIRICDPFDKEGQLDVFDEFVGYDPAWFGSSGWLAYMRGGQLYLRRDKEEVKVEGAEDIDGFLLSPMRDRIILIKQVKTVPTTADKYPDLPLATGHMHEDLMYKHWDEWTETAPQPFVCPLEITYYGEGERIKTAKVGEGINILEGTAFESPMKPFGGVEQLAWNPNNEEIAYTCRKKTGLDYAVSTNSDIYLYDIRTRTHKNITEDNKGYDTNPSYSPNGEWIAWLSMERDGYESDENRLMALNLQTGEKRFLSRTMDTNVDEFAWYNDSTLLFTACWHATVQLYHVNLHGYISRLTEGQFDLGLGDVSDHYAFVLGHSMRQANEIYRMDVAAWLEKDNGDYAHTEVWYDQPFDTYNQLLHNLYLTHIFHVIIALLCLLQAYQYKVVLHYQSFLHVFQVHLIMQVYSFFSNAL